MPPISFEHIRLQPRDAHPGRTGRRVHLTDALVGARMGRVPGGYAIESAASMIASLVPDDPDPAGVGGGPGSADASLSKLRSLARLVDGIRTDFPAESARVLEWEAARVAASLLAAYERSAWLDTRRDAGPGGRPRIEARGEVVRLANQVMSCAAPASTAA
ncbi:hypothetical protein [Rhodoplanes sp. SY1]|uniref:hypothetical protein n=1 Tax=Rhodoplanes sp. SY1 TaxID=3166646 RepID=UPI0038B5CB5A